MTLRLSAIVLAMISAVSALPARADDSFDSCTGYIDTLPATITKAGTWCLRAHEATASASGNAITVAQSNVTIDCNGFRLTGTATPATTAAIGIYASARTNTSVRNCRISGFDIGISLNGNGAAVLDNHIERLRSIAVTVTASPGRVQGNRINDIGIFATRPAPRGIITSGDVDILDNVVDHVKGSNATGRIVGILSQAGQSNVVARNSVMRTQNWLAGGTSGVHVGASNNASRTVVRDNLLVANGTGEPGVGLSCVSKKHLVTGNQVSGWTTGISSVCVASHNIARS